MNHNDAFYRIEIVTMPQEVPETSADLRLFYVVDGDLQIRKEKDFFHLSKSDLLLIGSEESIEIIENQQSPEDMQSSDRRFMLAMLSIDYFRLCSMQDTFVLKFHVNSQDDSGYKYTQLRDQMQNLLMAHVAQEKAGRYKEMGCFYHVSAAPLLWKTSSKTTILPHRWESFTRRIF